MWYAGSRHKRPPKTFLPNIASVSGPPCHLPNSAFRGGPSRYVILVRTTPRHFIKTPVDCLHKHCSRALLTTSPLTTLYFLDYLLEEMYPRHMVDLELQLCLRELIYSSLYLLLRSAQSGIVSNATDPRLYDLPPDVGMLARPVGPVIYSMEASFLD